MHLHADTIIRAVGLLAGCGLALAFVLAGRVDANRVAAPAALKVTVGSADELVVKPGGELLVARGLRPGAGGRGASSRIVLWNPTDVTLAVGARVVPSTPDLDRSVRIELGAGRRQLLAGWLGDLRRPSPARALTLRPGQRQAMRLSALVPTSVRTGYQAREVEAKLELSTEPERVPR